MLGIPFLSTYIQRIVKVQSVADSVDWLNYYCTSLLLAFFSLAISAKQYFGSPIQCWVPNEFKSSWEKYAENYCFIANSYFVQLDQEVPTELANRHDQISYYRWVPVALAIQALFFWLPNWLWNMLHKQTAINPRAMLAEAGKSRALHGAQREKEVEGLAAFLSDTLNIFWKENGRRHSLSGLNATLLYLAIKLLYVLNCFGQLIILNRFLGGKYHSWAWESFLALLRGEEWQGSAVFPRQILCDFSVRLLANNHRHTIQCVIMLNLINEKLYFFLHFWLLLVGIVTLINFFYYLLILMLASLRTEFVKRNINKRQQKLRGFGTRELTRFVQTRLRPDGVLLLHFIRQHIGGRVTYELLNELLRLHWLTQTAGSTSSTQTGHLTTSNSPNSEKVPEMRRTMNNGLVEELDEEEEGGINGERQMDPLMDGYSRQNTYKPTAYGPGALVYPGAEPIDGHHNHRLRPHLLATAPHPPFSPSSLLRAISGTASPTTLLMANGNHYSAPPTLEFIDGQSNETVKNVEEGEDGMKVICPICHCSFNNSFDLMIHEKTNHTQSAFLQNSDGDGDVEKQQKQLSSPNGTAKLRKAMTSDGQLPPMNTTPLTQSRRAKSPLVTGLGTMGKRQGNNVEMSKNNNSADDESFLVKPMEEIEKINNSAV